MQEVHMWLYLVVAAIMAIIIGRLGTLLKDRIKQPNQKPNKLS